MRVVIADKHPMIRYGIKYILRSHFPSADIREAENGDETIACCKQDPVDILLMDLDMPDTKPGEMIAALLMQQPSLNILILTVSKEEVFGPLYLKMGVRGFIPKICSEQEIIKAIRTVLAGNIYIREEMLGLYATRMQLNNPFDILTLKEKEILHYFINGDSTRYISKVMQISATTVSTHKAHILKKMKVESLFDLRSLADIYPL